MGGKYPSQPQSSHLVPCFFYNIRRRWRGVRHGKKARARMQLYFRKQKCLLWNGAQIIARTRHCLRDNEWKTVAHTLTHTHPTMESLWQRAKTMCASHDCNRGECGWVQMIKNGSRNSKETYSSRASSLFFALSHCQNVICYISFRIEFKSLPFLNRITKIGHNSLKYTSKTLILSWNDHLLS